MTGSHICLGANDWGGESLATMTPAQLRDLTASKYSNVTIKESLRNCDIPSIMTLTVLSFYW